jgi:transketolase
MDKIDYLKKITGNIKRTFLTMYKNANAGHIGSSLSCAEILGITWFHYKNPDDYVILSKGHAAAALYATLHEAGLITKFQIDNFYKNGTLLPAHPPINKFKDIPFATGSLGHGLSIGAGFGYAFRLKKSSNKVFCITSDGELNEGSTWEAALFISHHNLTNVIWIIDRNRLQGFGYTENVLGLDPLDKKLEAFGFYVIQVDGHCHTALIDLKAEFYSSTIPVVVIANTTKGNGWIGRQNTLDSHYVPMNDTEFSDLINVLNNESRV